ncbi:MAG: hypothetical protein RLY31_159 [Bacteroidota bacterium]|jgi:miniconductance mechanosensitive channel
MLDLSHWEDWVERLLHGAGVMEAWLPYLRLLIFVVTLTILAVAGYFLTKRILLHYLYKVFQKSPIRWDDLLAEHRTFDNLAHIVPALLIRTLAPVLFDDFTDAVPLVVKLTDSYLAIVGMTVVLALLKVGELSLSSIDSFRDKPLSSYFQLVRIILYIVTLVFVLSILLEKSPLYFLSAFGAMTAILLLIFKDTILGLVASVQISANDMVRVGDWVEMPKFHADGDVVAINLHTVKVRNWDKTITSIPTYHFITDSFKNWRGMVQSGGRRIKRSFYIHAHSVRFLSPERRHDFKSYQLVREFLEQRQQEINAYNQSHNIDTSVLINGRRMTNIGVFRKYLETYLRQHPAIRQDMTVMVRQLAPESRGIPMEIYCFTNTTAWLEYESIQADVFDHVFAAIPFFDLDLFQETGSRDITEAVRALNPTTGGTG